MWCSYCDLTTHIFQQQLAKVEEISKNSDDMEKETAKEKINEKLTRKEENRKAQISALQARLKEHVR